MYSAAVPRIGEERPAYGPHEVDRDGYPAAGVLKDLAAATDEDVPRVIARYAALRSRLLQDEDGDPVLVRHADRTARAYLAAVADWPETAALSRLAAAGGPAPAWEAGIAASAAGHNESAHALFRAGYMAARRAGDIPWAARLAAANAAFLQSNGMDGADLWCRRAARLRKFIDRG